MCGGIASRTSTSTPPPIPKRVHARRANVAARSACEPVTTTSSPGIGLTLTTTRGDSIPTPQSDSDWIEHAEVQPCRGGDDDLAHVRSAT
jgi:hypothetical protein